MINWTIARNPVNWITVLLMFYIAAFGVDIVMRYFERSNSNG